MKFILSFSLLSQLVVITSQHYTNHKLIQVTINNDQDLQSYRKFEQSYNMDTWGHPRLGSVKARISPEFFSKLPTEFPLDYKLLHQNVQELVDESNIQANSLLKDDFFDNYHTTNEIYDYLDNLVKKSNGLASWDTVGQTYLNKTIKAVKVTKNSNYSTKPQIIINGGIHAREWIGISTVTYLADQLISKSNSNPKLKLLVDTFDFYLIPVLNIDGYEYTQTERLWRKNLQPNAESDCIGTDLNRNWDYAFNNTSQPVCDEKWAGASPFSTPETRAIANYIQSKSRTISFIDVHSFGQLWMHPYAYKCDPSPNEEAYERLGRVSTAAMVEAGGPQFTYGSICKVIYQAYGSSVDWALEKGNIKYPLAVELKDNGTYGLLLPPVEIEAQGREFTAAIAAFGAELKKIEKL